MSAFTKIVAGISTVGAVGGGVALGAYSLLGTKNIQGRLREEGYETLDTSATNDDWEKVLKAYKLANKNTFTGSKDGSLDDVTLRNKCKDIFSKKADTESDYLLARQWCVKERTANDILKKLGLRELKTEPVTGSAGTTTNADDADWTNIADKYEDSKSQYKIAIEPADSNPINKEKIKAACKKLDIANLKTTTDDFNNKLEQAKEWCTIAKEKPAN